MFASLRQNCIQIRIRLHVYYLVNEIVGLTDFGLFVRRGIFIFLVEIDFLSRFDGTYSSVRKSRNVQSLKNFLTFITFLAFCYLIIDEESKLNIGFDWLASMHILAKAMFCLKGFEISTRRGDIHFFFLCLIFKLN